MSVRNFLRQALSERRASTCPCWSCGWPSVSGSSGWGWIPTFEERYLNEGFSGGEKKRNEILQMAILEPEMAILDETDSGLDIDALRIVGGGVEEIRKDRPEMGVLAITHYQRLLDYLHARRGPPDDRRSHRRERRPRAGPAHRGRGIRGVAMIDVAEIRSQFPILAPGELDGKAPGLPGLRRQLATTPGRARRHGRALPATTTPTCTAASTGSPRKPPTPSRRPGPESPGSSTPPRLRKWSSPRTPPRR